MVTTIKKGASRNQIKNLMERHLKRKGKTVNVKKYCGILKLKEDPLDTQRKWRNEWE